MGDVLDFPSSKTQGIVYLEREFRQLLESRGSEESLINFATEELTRIYSRLTDAERHSFSITLPDGLSTDQQDTLTQEIDRELEGLHRDNHRLQLELCAQLLLAQVRLYHHEGVE